MILSVQALWIGGPWDVCRFDGSNHLWDRLPFEVANFGDCDCYHHYRFRH